MSANGQIYLAKHLPQLAREGRAIHIRLGARNGPHAYRVLSAQLIDAGISVQVARGRGRYLIVLQDTDFVEVFE